MRYEVTLDDIHVRVDLTPEGRFVVDERVVAADVRERVRGRQWSVTLDGESRGHEPAALKILGLALGPACEKAGVVPPGEELRGG